MQIISAGEKIRKLRLDLGLNQADLTNDEITRGLISMIENNKRSLTYNTARIIANSFNKYYKKLGKEITPDYLMESDIQYIERLIQEGLDEMQPLLNNPMPGNQIAVETGIERLINLSKEWKLDRLTAKLLETRGRFYTAIYQYNDALRNYFLSLEYYLKENLQGRAASLYTVIGSSYYHLSLYDQALLYYFQAENMLIKHPHTFDDLELKKGYTIYNKALCHRKLKDLKSVLEALNQFKVLNLDNDNLNLLMLLLEGDMYRDLHNYNKSEKIYDQILKSKNCTSELLLLVYDSYAIMHY